MEMIDIIYVLGSIFQALAFELYFENTMKRKNNKHITLIVIILMLLFSDFILDEISGDLKVVISALVLFILINLLYKNTIKKKIIVCLLLHIFLLISEMFVGLFLNLCMIQGDNYYLVGYVLSKILILLIVRIILLINEDIS